MLRQLGFVFVILTWVSAAHAQDTYIQLEAYSSQPTAERRIPQLATRLPDIVAHQIPAGWVAISMGPYARPDAVALLRQFRATGQVNRDAFVTDGRNYRTRIYPVGEAITEAEAESPPATEETQQPVADAVVAAQGTAETPTAPEPAPEQPPAEDTAPQTQTAVAVTQVDDTPEEPAADETPQEALRSERTLSRQDKRDLQTAMAWAGTYKGAIDGLYGPGTRRAMQAWQEQKGLEPTGVLTTLQRAALLADYNAVLDGLGLELVQDEETGVELKLPLAVLPDRQVGYPFKSYTGSDGIEVHVISRPGERVSFDALYSVLQTLEMLPPEGPRRLQRGRFFIEGTDSKKTSFAQAELRSGMIRGFVLVWPNDDEARRTRVLDEMRASFGTFGRNVLSEDNLRDTGTPLAAVSLRKPRRVQSGVFVASDGAILTALDDLASCGRLSHMSEDQSLGLAAEDPALNLALLRPSDRMAPLAVAAFRDTVPPLQSQIAIAGFSYDGMLGAPTLTFGAIAGNTGLDGKTTRKRLQAMANPSDAGGAVMDQTGALVGMLLPSDVTGKKLPSDVAFSVPVTELRAALSDWGITAKTAEAGARSLTPHDQSLMARDMVTLIQCWD